MSAEEQGWWSQTLRDVKDRIERFDDRLRAVEEAFKNGVSDTLSNMNGTLEQMQQTQRNLQQRVERIENRHSMSTELRNAWLKYIGSAMTGAGLLFAAMRLFT
jgi:archaellum component FlaC